MVPRMNANDDYSTIGEWCVGAGSYVNKDETLAVIETGKDCFDIYAPAEGYLQILVPCGEKVETGSLIAIISDCAEGVKREDAGVEESTTKCVVTDKAAALMEKHSVSSALFSNYSIVRERDVLAQLKRNVSVPNIEGDALLLFGGGRFARVVIDIIHHSSPYKIAGIADRQYPQLKAVAGYPVLAGSSPEDLQMLYGKGYTHIINTLSFIGNRHARKDPYLLLHSIGYTFENIIHSRAVIEPTVRLGQGNIIMPNAVLSTGSDVRDNCIINANTVISHDCFINSHSHIASGAVLGGNVIVGENTLIGQNCTIYMGVRIGANVVIQNGAVVNADVPDNSRISQ